MCQSTSGDHVRIEQTNEAGSKPKWAQSGSDAVVGLVYTAARFGRPDKSTRGYFVNFLIGAVVRERDLMKITNVIAASS